MKKSNRILFNTNPFHKYLKLLFLLLYIPLSPSLAAMDYEITMELPITIKQEYQTISPALLHIMPKVEEPALAPLLLPLAPEVSPVLEAAAEAMRAKRTRTPTRLKYYAEFLCDQVSSDAEEQYSNSEEFTPDISPKRTRIVLKKETDTAKPFACHLCPKSYDEKHYLNRHIRTSHNDDRPFSCYLCHKSFKEKHHLDEHVNRHGDARVYCSECSKPFKRNPELTRHLRDVHRIQKQNIPICSQ